MIIYSPHLSPQTGLVSPGAWTPDIIHIKKYFGLSSRFGHAWFSPEWSLRPESKLEDQPQGWHLFTERIYIVMHQSEIKILIYQHIKISKYQNIKLMKANQCAGEAHGARSVYKLPTKSRGRSENHNYMTRCQIWCTIEVHRDPISKVLSEW